MRLAGSGCGFVFGLVALVLTGCGGGGSSDAVCADFQYQEEAQAAFSSGAKQLDGDNDGVACEALPHRPSGSGTSGGTALPAYDLILAQGTVAALRPAFGGYSLSYGNFGGGGGASGPLIPTAAGGALQIALDALTMRYVTTSDSTLLTWPPAQGGGPTSTGVGVADGDAASLAELAGSYKLLGQRCAAGTTSCRSTFATARITPDGNLQLCPEAEFSETCDGRDIRALTTWRSIQGSVRNVWSLESGSSVLVGSRTRHTLALTYENWSLDSNFDRVTTDHFTFFGQRDDATVTSILAFTSMLGFDSTGVLRNSVPTAARWAVSANTPIGGLFSDSNGDFYLRSTTGQLVSWSPVEGLRHHSNP